VDNRPLHFADFDLLVVYNFCAALHQIAGVNLRVKDSCHRAGVPVPIVYLVLSKFKYILLTAVLCATLAATYAFFIMKPIYAATAKLYIMGQDSSSILADLQIGSYLTMDYQEVFKTWEVHEMVREELSLSYSYKDMQDMLKVTNPSDTRVLYIIVKNADPHLATSMANAYAKAAKKFILETMDSEEPSTFSVALVPGTATGISRTGCVAIGLLVGTALAVVVILLKELLDTRPKTPEDIAQCADIPTLAIVPSTTAKLKQSKRRKYEST
jgi:capsular polysaccharide biosynthesis protein